MWDDATLAHVDALLTQMAEHQRKKRLRLAQEVVPHLTDDDLMNPHDFEPLASDMTFHYEDGFLNGVIAVVAMVRAERAASRP